VVPVVPNVTAEPTSDPKQILRALVAQVTGTVRWRESITAMSAAGVTAFYELGAGKVLCGLVKRIAAQSQCFSVGTPQEVRAFTLAPE
jgi:[acyl-carrier-protein] S-malonyltransferase